MPDNKFIRFFDKEGNDMNLGATSMPLVSLYDSTSQDFDYYHGGIYFPKVSINLIESQQLFLLQEVTGPTSSYELRKVTGEATVISGNPTIVGEGSDFTTLEVGYTLKVLNEDFTISAIAGPTSMTVTPTPDFNSTTFDIYYYDYLSYTQPRSTIGTFKEHLEVDFLPLGSSVSTTQFFLYDVDYSQDAPFIEKFYLSEIEIADGSSDTIDSLTGRVELSTPVTSPTQINLGFSSDTEYNYEQDLVINSVQEYQEPLIASPTFLTTSFTFTIGGTGHPLYDNVTEFYLQGVTGAGATATFYNQKLAVISVTTDGTDTFIETKPINFSSTAYSSYRIYFVNKLPITKMHLYGETEGEDERFRMVLQNFGRSINTDNEFIFRESDISEDLSNFEILNKKRKELLLEGDNIYPYLGSYRALINIINFFGYYDLRIKEYFLNVDEASSNYGKYLHLLIPRDEAQRKEVKKSWQIVPSKIYKKTSLFGLFYDLNRATDEEDIYGIPTVEDAFDFSPEEVLIKLFGLKEVLKKEFLPLNARIYDITGEGIYFERIRIDSWADNLQYFSLDLGKRPEFKIYPDVAYVSDLRRMDSFYVAKFTEQGLTGFLGPSASDPGLNALGYTGPLQSLETTNIISYSYFLDTIYDPDGNLLPPVDNSWDYMPPGISNPDFNTIASRLRPLPDEIGIVSGGPALLEAFFDISWEESYFTWAQLGILGPTGAPLNINIWTWESLGRGEYTELRWTIQKSGFNGFNYDSGRRPITDYVVETRGATAFTIPARMRANVSGGSFVDIDLLSAGYGYTASPAIYIPSPDQVGGTPATATCTVADGYVTSVSFTPGSGYSYPPTITVEPPGVTYEPINRILNAVALPYEGVYDVGLYIYDICNNYTVEFQKYTVKNKQVDFVSSFRRETSERTWQDFGNAPQPADFDTGLGELITWKDVTGPWYYPIHVSSSWKDAEISWESLNFSQFKDQSLYEYELNSSIFKIDRDSKYVILSGNLTGNLNNLSSLNVGDYLFLERYESDLIEENLSIDSIPTSLLGAVYGVNVNVLSTSNNPLFGQVGSQRLIVNAFVNQAQIDGQTITLVNAIGQTNSRTVVGIQVNTPSAGLTRINFASTFTYDFSQAAGGYFVWGDPQGVLVGNISMATAIGSTVVSTEPWDTTNYLNPSDRVYITGAGWRIVDTVGPTSFSVTLPYETSVTGATGFSYSGETMQLQLNYTSPPTISMNRYSRLVITDDCKYTNLNPSTDFYQFVDGLTYSSSSITVTGTDEALQSIIMKANVQGVDLHATWGIFSGTYALEITGISLTGSNTLFRLKDDNKELYYLDGNFSPRFADYDVDYAETRIGFESLNFENLNETTWEENKALTWYGAEYHGGSLCGFLVPFVAPGGYMTIDENPTFVFSGNQDIASTKQGLGVAVEELINSENAGASLYEYSVLPESELYITDISGLPTDVAADTPAGSTTVILNATPFGGTLKIPATLTVLFNISGAVTNVFIVDEGWGYDSPPTITLVSNNCISNEAVITCTIGNGGYIDSVTVVNAGSGYTAAQTTIEVTAPRNYEEHDNYVWTGSEWVEVIGVNTGFNYQLLLGTALQYDVPGGTFLLLPYDYHKQVFLKPETFQQYYYFIQAKSITPSSNSLSYVNMGDGVQSEWAQHPDRTYSYPLRNSLYFLAMNDQADLSQDYLYNNWVYEGSDYPPTSVPPIYESDVLSYSSRLPFVQSLQGCFSFIDTVVSSEQKKVPQCTPVVFHYDKCTIPGKNNPLWTITDEEVSKIIVMSQEDKLVWNFTRPGSFTVSLSLSDANGNTSVASKNSFIVVNGD